MLSGKQIAVYSGRSKILRLLFIANKCNCNEAMRLEALRMVYDKIKKGSDTNLHRKVCSKTHGRLGPKYTVDHAWVESVEQRFAVRREKLENELNGYRTQVKIQTASGRIKYIHAIARADQLNGGEDSETFSTKQLWSFSFLIFITFFPGIELSMSDVVPNMKTEKRRRKESRM